MDANAAISSDEWTARVELAAAYRIIASEGLDDGIWNHLSAAIPGREGCFLLKAHGLLFSEVTASNLLVVALDGTLLSGDGQWEPTAFYIHSRIHAAFPEFACVMHLHPPHATALCCTRDMRLLPIGQDGLRFHGRLGYFHDYGGLALSDEEGDKMVEALRGQTAIMMASHGVLVGGRTIAEALYDMHYLEVACRTQTMARQASTDGQLLCAPPEITDITAHQINRNRLADAAQHLAAYIRQLDRIGENFRD